MEKKRISGRGRGRVRGTLKTVKAAERGKVVLKEE